MSNEKIWAPWRLEYVKGDKSQEKGCFLCRCRDEADDAGNLVVLRSRRCLVVLNRFPYNNGHLLVAPAAHKGHMDELDDEEMLDCTRQLQKMTSVYRGLLNPDGFNIGLNLGRAAGAGLPGHLHWHLVPRWQGDTNFMPVLAGVDVIPQSLESLFASLRKALDEREL